ncbi:DUF4870 domain-containing protein [Brevibacterium sp. ZH18]|uniref:DUF4870 domain-containing protein n=1 Tax=Brevibacterium sp. ZH18 TaxID=2927784 RepID=UPI001F603C1E|nr:DUF4870 domain-containing protein [Brevibacterium sp. ZH18]MCI4011975.1 DUF4870 domain-containing protein [Brevibacterium sp. ZH18]
MSYNPQHPNNGSDQARPMPPDYSQASGPQQPYSQPNQQNFGSQQNAGSQNYGSQNYGAQQQSQPGYGSAQQNPQTYNSQQGHGSQQNYGSAQGQQYGSGQQYGAQQPQGQQYGSGQPYGQQQYAQPPYGGPQAQGAPRFAGNPALFDSHMLPENAYGPGSAQFWMPNESDRTTVLWTHIGALFFGFLPLIMFLVKKDESPFVREHTRQGLNAWITNMIATFAASFVLGIIGFILALVTFGLGILIVYFAFIIPCVYMVFYIIAAIAGNKGEGYKFPLTFEFVK